MGQTAHGYELRWRGPARGWTVRFRLNGRRRELATDVRGRREKGAAERAAREIYAAEVRGEKQRGPVAGSKEPLEEVVDRWLDSLGLRPITRELYEKYGGYWLDRWATLGHLTAGAIAVYSDKRLREARGKTVANELSALRRMLTWCVATRRLAALPAFPTVNKAQGAKASNRTRAAAPELTPEEVWAVIDALPLLSGREGWPVRARAIVAYTTTLRPATLDKLSAPEHYSKGASVIRVTADIDKESAEREVPLPPVAREALDSVCPDIGLIFGRHTMHHYLRPAAATALPPHKAAIFTAQHFRSAGITHALERSSNLAGVQYLAGHKDAKTTSRYVRASFRAALEVVDTWGTGRGTKRKKAR